MELLMLPVELVHCISSFLPVEDILSLSLTCHYLRDVLNDDFVWKRLLPNEDLSCLESQKHQVEPPFQPPPVLTPLCQNRLCFMKKTHLLNNFRQGNFKAHTLQDVDSCTSSLIPNSVRSSVRFKGQIIYGDDFLFLSAYFDEFELLEVWNIEKEPVIHSAIKCDSFLTLEYFEVVGNHLIFVNDFKVSVYGITVPEKLFSLKHSFLVHLDEIVYGPAGKELEQDSILLHCFHYVVGENLVSIPNGQLLFHVWNILEPKKLGVFYLLDQRIGSQEVLSELSIECSAKDNIILSINLRNNFKRFVGFNLAEKSFSRFELNHEGKTKLTLMDNGFVIIFTHKANNSQTSTVLTLYDYKTSQKLKERKLNVVRPNSKWPKKTKIMNGKLIVLCGDSLEVIDVETLDTTSTIECHAVSHITKVLDLLGSIFVIVCNNDFQLEIWDINKKRKCSGTILFGKNPESKIYFNRSCTKMVCSDWIFGSIIIFHLW